MNKISSYIFLSVSFSRVLQISNFILDIFIIISKSAEEKQFRDKREKQISSYTLNHFIFFHPLIDVLTQPASVGLFKLSTFPRDERRASI